MRIMLIRHGMTEANERRLYCGATDLPLTDAGREALLRQKAQGIYPDVSGMRRISSGMRRTDETMELLFGCAPDLRCGEFREINFGRFEMHSYEELKDDNDYQEWIMDESGRSAPPGGECSADFQARVIAAAEALAADALVVCHGGVIAALMQHFFPESEKNMYQWQPGFGRGYLLERDGGAWRCIAEI